MDRYGARNRAGKITSKSKSTTKRMNAPLDLHALMRLQCPHMAATEAEFLLIDNSNSFTKFAISTRKEISAPRRLSTPAVEKDSLVRILHGWKFQSVIMCSVVPTKGELLTQLLAPHRVLSVNAKTKLGVGIDYPRRAPSARIASRMPRAPRTSTARPAVVVDFGTAVSFDIVSKEETYVGGVIAPGLEAMTDYLHQRTALLPKISLLEPPSAIGKSTRHAMLAGAVHGYRGLVREILDGDPQNWVAGKSSTSSPPAATPT